MEKAVIVSAVRTPVGSFGKSLCQVPAVDLGTIALKESLRRMGLDAAQVDEVILGNVLQAGSGRTRPGRSPSNPVFQRKSLLLLSIRFAPRV